MAAPKRLSPAQIINRLRKAEVAMANGKNLDGVKTRKGRAQWPHQRG